MQVTLKLFANLSNYLPSEAVDNQLVLDIKDGQTVRGLLVEQNVPPELCHLLLVNGVYSPPSKSDNIVLKAGDTVAVWPPVAGG